MTLLESVLGDTNNDVMESENGFFSCSECEMLNKLRSPDCDLNGTAWCRHVGQIIVVFNTFLMIYILMIFKVHVLMIFKI